jgi:hypothetical protein
MGSLGCHRPRSPEWTPSLLHLEEGASPSVSITIVCHSRLCNLSPLLTDDYAGGGGGSGTAALQFTLPRNMVSLPQVASQQIGNKLICPSSPFCNWHDTKLNYCICFTMPASGTAAIVPGVMPLVGLGGVPSALALKGPSFSFKQPLETCRACKSRPALPSKAWKSTTYISGFVPHTCLCEICQTYDNLRTNWCEKCGAYAATGQPLPHWGIQHELWMST